MLRHRAIRREYDDAGSVNGLLALWAFVDDETFVTKAGDVGVVYRLQGGQASLTRAHGDRTFKSAIPSPL